MLDAAGLHQRLLEYYSRNHELFCPYHLDGTIYDTYAHYSQFDCTEHAFIRSTLTLSKTDLLRFREQLTTYIEPWLIRRGKSSPGLNHIYTYVTGIFISERKLSNDVCRAIRHFRYYKGYGYYRSGYCQARIAAFDLERGSVVCSPAAKDLMEEYREILG